MTAVKGVRAEIVKGRNHSANGGVSDHAQSVTIVGEGFREHLEPTPEAPAVRLVKRRIGGKVAYYFEPLDKPQGSVGPMASGAFVHGYGADFEREVGYYGAVPLHDRYETRAQYDALSR